MNAIYLSTDFTDNTMNAIYFSTDFTDNTMNAIYFSTDFTDNTMNAIYFSTDFTDNTMNAIYFSTDFTDNTMNAIYLSTDFTDNTMNAIYLSTDFTDNTMNAIYFSTDFFYCGYRTMLSDGDSVAFNAVANAKSYGDDHPISKVECVNHVHKRMGTALRKLAKEEKLGGKGHGRLTLQKCNKLQGYFRGAVLNNQGCEDELRNAVWASSFHCISTDEHPHHLRCPPGPHSWCFFQRALAHGLLLPSSSAFDMMVALTRFFLPRVPHIWMSGANPLQTPRAWF